jgi:hypothetical protein
LNEGRGLVGEGPVWIFLPRVGRPQRRPEHRVHAHRLRWVSGAGVGAGCSRRRCHPPRRPSSRRPGRSCVCRWVCAWPTAYPTVNSSPRATPNPNPNPGAPRKTPKRALPSSAPGVPEDQIIGIRYGLRGFYEKGTKPVTLTRKSVDGIHLKGGTMLVRAQHGGGGNRREGAAGPSFLPGLHKAGELRAGARSGRRPRPARWPQGI